MTEPGSKSLSEHDSKELLASYGVALARESLAESADEAVHAATELGFPVVLKLCGDSIAHKTERDLVRLNLPDASAVRTAGEELLSRRRPEDGEVGLLVAELVAIVLTLAAYVPGTFLTELSKMSMYLLWLALLGDALLCQIRPWAERQGNTQAFVICFVLLLVLCLALAEVAYQLTGIFAESVIINDTHRGFLTRTFAKMPVSW